MNYEYIPGGFDRDGNPFYSTKYKIVGDDIVKYYPTRAVNAERRAKRRVCAHLGITSGRQTRKLRKAIRRGAV